MVSTGLPNYEPPSLFNNPLDTEPKAQIKISIIVIFMFHSFSIPLQGPGSYPSFHILSVLFCGQPGQRSQQICKFSFLFFVVVVVVDYY